MPDITAPGVTPAAGAGPATTVTPTTTTTTPITSTTDTSTTGGTQETTTTETPDVFKFDFGDGEKWEHEAEEEQPVAGNKETLDTNKPFDPNLDAALKDKPELLKSVKDLYFREKNWRTAGGFKNPAELKAHQARLNEIVTNLGRQEKGLDAIEAEAKEWATTLAGFRSGDPAVLDTWFEGNADGMGKLMPAAMSKWFENNPTGWANQMAKVFVSTITNPSANGQTFLNAFNTLYQQVGNNPDAKALLDYMADELNGVIKISSQKAGTETAAPSEAAKKVAMGERQVYLQKTDIRASKFIDSAARQALKVALKGQKVSDEVMDDLLGDIRQAFNKIQLGDSNYQKNALDLLNQKEDSRFDRLLKSQLTRTMPNAVRNVIRKYKGLSGGNADRKADAQSRRETAAGGAANTPQVIKYTGKIVQGGPDPSVVDYAAMRAKYGRDGMSEQLANHRFIKKGDNTNTYSW